MDIMQEVTVVKRNGAIVPFRRERIFRALEAAFRDTKKIEKDADRDSWMRASEAKSYGHIDEVLERKVPGKAG